MPGLPIVKLFRRQRSLVMVVEEVVVLSCGVGASETER